MIWLPMTISMMAMNFDDFNGSDTIDEFDDGAIFDESDTNDEFDESEY